MTCGRRAGSSTSGLATGSRISAISSASAEFHFLVGHFAAEAADPEFANDPPRDRMAEIGGRQEVFEFLEGFIVEPALGEGGGDAAGEFLRAALQAFLEAREKAERHYAGPLRRERLVQLR